MKRTLLVVLALAGAVLAAGCSGGNPDNAGSAGAGPMSLRGVVHGGQAPIVGAAVTLYAASQQASSEATLFGDRHHG